MLNEQSINELMVHYDAAEDDEDWDLCRDLEDIIARRKKILRKSMRCLIGGQGNF